MFLQTGYRTAAFGLYGFLHFTKSGFQNHSKYFKAEEMQIQLNGKNCIVTGANSGIGYATAEGLASRGATVYMVCRSRERGEAALSEIQSKTGNANVYMEICDLSSVSEIKSFASRFSSNVQSLHVLVNNAGLIEHNCVTTADGLELNYAVNVAGTYAMTELMLPLLEKAAPDARVITVSSGGMYTSPLTKDLEVTRDRILGKLTKSMMIESKFTLLNSGMDCLGGTNSGVNLVLMGYLLRLTKFELVQLEFHLGKLDCLGK